MSEIETIPSQATSGDAPTDSARIPAFDDVAASHPTARTGPRLWALPDTVRGWWIVCENDDGRGTGLIQGTPSIFVPDVSIERRIKVAERCREFVAERFRDRWHDDLFQLIKRVMFGGVFFLGAVFALRFIEIFDIPLLLGTFIYLVYACIRYGTRFMNSVDLSNHPYTNFVGEPFVQHALAERLVDALEFRRTLAVGKPGTDSNRDLSNAAAYRALIREGVVSRVELLALGLAVQKRLGISVGLAKPVAELAQQAKLGMEACALYRDLALATAEIETVRESK